MNYEDQSHRFAITGHDLDGRPRTILWRSRPVLAQTAVLAAEG